MKRYRNLYPQVYDFNSLYWAYRNARRGKTNRGEVLRFTARLEEHLITLQNELIWKTYKQAPYREFYVTEPKSRLIMALPFRDRVVQWSIYQLLMPIADRKFIFDSYACRPGKGTHAALDRLRYWLRGDPDRDKLYVLKMDIHRYFYRVNHDILLSLYRKWIADDDLMWLIEHIVRASDGGLGIVEGSTDYDTKDTGVGMAVGNLLSQLSANIYLNEVDQFAKHRLRLKRYARYQDDILVLHHDKALLHRVRRDIECFLTDNLALVTNEKTQIRPVSQGIDWVGFRVWPTHVRLRKSTARRMRRRLRSLQRKYERGEVDFDTVHQSMQSYMGALKHCDSYGLRKVLTDELVFRRQDDCAR